MIVSLPYPHKHLWSNGPRGNVHAVAREKRKHKEWAYFAAKAQPRPELGGDLIRVSLTVYPKPKGPLPDRDNCVSALKVYQDGISKAIGINDKNFAEPTVRFAPERTGHFVIEIGEPVE